MRSDVSQPADPTFVTRAETTVTLYPTTTDPGGLIAGDPGGGTDVTEFVGVITQTSFGAAVELNYADEFSGANRPKLGQPVAIRQGSTIIFNGVVTSISAERESRALRLRQVTLNVATRDATPWWREARRTTGPLGSGGDLAAIARSMAEALGLAAGEYQLPDIGVTLAHQNAQLADMPAWDIMETALEPGLVEPFVDARGVLKTLPRSVIGRTPNITPPSAEVVEYSGAIARPPCTRFRVKYLSPTQARVDKQECRLASAMLQLSFWKMHDEVDVTWSDDGRQRAEGTYMKIIHSVNASSGIFSVAAAENEAYEQTDDYGGRITLDVDAGAFALDLAVGLAMFVAGVAVPDIAPPLGGAVVPLGRMVENAAMIQIMHVLMRNGIGRYEIWGVPYDYVDAVNEVEAYDQDAPLWATKIEELQNDLIPNDTVASAVAVNELVYRSRVNNKAEVVIADDLRVEPGDVLGMPDGRAMYVVDYERDLTRGSQATLRVEGFWL